MTLFRNFLMILILLPLGSWGQQKPTLILYCGITMVKPITEIAHIIEKKFNCKINISQGGSQDLYDALKYSQKGDLYLPGSNSYREKNLKDGYLLEGVEIGYNQAAIIVPKNNPKDILSVDNFIKEEFASILANTQSGSIGRMTKQILIKAKGESFYQHAYDNAAQIGSDSRNLNYALINKEADMTINWKATALWEENRDYLDVVPLDESISPKKKLVINLLSFSQHPHIAKELMHFAQSKEGQKIMKKYGFFD